MKWFGESWRAPICEPGDEVETPVGESCLLCEEPIGPGDQGVIMPFSGDLVNGVATARLVPEHLDCFLDSILSHGPDCPRCRGLEPDVHAEGCAYRTGENEGRCSCEKGKTMEKLLDSSLTLAEAQRIADEMGMELDYLLTVVRRRRTRPSAHARETRKGDGPAV